MHAHMLAGTHAYTHTHTHTHTHMYTACKLDDFKTVFDFLPTPSILVSVQQRRTCDGCSPPQGVQLCCGKEDALNGVPCYLRKSSVLCLVKSDSQPLHSKPFGRPICLKTSASKILQQTSIPQLVPTWFQLSDLFCMSVSVCMHVHLCALTCM